jgi:hypothetical protein
MRVGKNGRCGRAARSAAAWGFAVLLLVAAGDARETPRLVAALSYKVEPGISGCPSEPDFRRAVMLPLGYDPFRNEAAHQVTAQVQSSERGLEGQVLWTDAAGNKEGERRLSSPNRDCAELARGMTFAIAVQIQLLNSSAPGEAATDRAATPRSPGDAAAPGAGAASAAPVGSSPPPVPTPAAVPAPTAATPPAAAPANTMVDKVAAAGPRDVAPPERFVAVGVGSRADVGFLSSPSAGARVFGGVRYDVLSFELAAFANLPTNYRQDDGTGFSMGAFGASFAPCGHLQSLAFCVVGVVGRIRVEGFGVDDVRTPSSTFVQAGLRAALDHSFGGRFAARVYADGLATLTPHTVTLNQVPAWTTPIGAIGVGLDFVVLFR